MDSSPILGSNLPSNFGGRNARAGYQYQDVVTVRYCVESASDSGWDGIKCETHEDIVLRRVANGKQHHRFVQVKYEHNAHKHWSIADLLRFEKTKDPNFPKDKSNSVLGKLFSNLDRFEGTCDYRLATNEGVDSELAAFAHHWNETEPIVSVTDAPAAKLIKKLQEPPSLKCRAVPECVLSFRIEHHGQTIDDLVSSVQRSLNSILRDLDLHLLQDQQEEVFRELYLRIHDQAALPPQKRGALIEFTRESLIDLIRISGDKTVSRTNALASAGPEELRTQLSGIGVSEVSIANAEDERREVDLLFRRFPQSTSKGKQFAGALREIRSIANFIAIQASSPKTPEEGMSLLMLVMEKVTQRHSEHDDILGGLPLSDVHGIVYWLIGKGRLRLLELEL